MAVPTKNTTQQLFLLPQQSEIAKTAQEIQRHFNCLIVHAHRTCAFMTLEAERLPGFHFVNEKYQEHHAVHLNEFRIRNPALGALRTSIYF